MLLKKSIISILAVILTFSHFLPATSAAVGDRLRILKNRNLHDELIIDVDEMPEEIRENYFRDNDRDGVLNYTDNCPDDHNRNQRDEDLDGIGNVCEYFFSGPIFYESGLSNITGVVNGNLMVGNDADEFMLAGANGTLALMMNSGSGTFSLYRTYDTPYQWSQIEIATLTRDRSFLTNIILSSENRIIIFGLDINHQLIEIGSYPTGKGPDGIETSDFNNDDIPDIAVANSADEYISIFFGNGDATFSDAVNYHTGRGPITISVEYFNDDSYPDLAVANYDDNDITVLLGSRNGVFTNAGNYATGDHPIAIAVNDINNDGSLDIATANPGSDNITILLGNGDGTFTDAVSYNVGSYPVSISIGDIDGDRHLDIATANSSSDNISLLLGNRDGTFDDPINFEAGNSPISIVIENMDNDADLDVVAVTFDGSLAVFENVLEEAI